MLSLPVFAGLGPTDLFSDRTRQTALEDASDRGAQALLKSCHDIFLADLSNAANEDDTSICIALGDFKEPNDLLRPPKRYHRNAVIQNTTLCLVQLIRYYTYALKVSSGDGFERDSFERFGVAGFCSGLIAAVAAATYNDNDRLQFFSQGRECFHLALLVGLRCEQHKRKSIENKACDADLPWSLIVNGITTEESASLVWEYNKTYENAYVYISAKNSEKCVTVSGRGNDLHDFVKRGLPEKCRIRPTSIYCLYHSFRALGPVKAKLLKDVASRRMSFPSFADLKVPIYSTVNGKPVMEPHGEYQDSLLEYILDMILLRPVDWMSVQEQIFSDIEGTTGPNNQSVDILNFGPAYGISRNSTMESTKFRIVDVSKSARPSTSISDNDIAIVGMHVDLPGAPNNQALWKILTEGINTVSEIPDSRFHVDDFYQADGVKSKNPERSVGTRFGNFMDDPFQFDNAFFGISPREAKSIDPQQRVVLSTTYKALEDSGYIPDATPSFMRETFGCYIGNATLDYSDNLKDHIDVYYSPGTLRAFLSGRISYAFGFSGPSMTVDTACSSSMVSIYHACRALSNGDCRAAVAGGVNVITSPDMYLGLDRAHFLSHTGQCKAFDASADGYCRSEGCGVFVLKKLSDALNESDHIWGIIKGVEVNQSGNSTSITHPHAPTQERLFDTLFTKADIDPLRVSVVQAHGTGTQAGDPLEMTSIRNGLCSGRDQRNPLYITSIKANIGHCEAASGAAALAKLLLMTLYNTIPAQISLKNLNPKISPLGVDGAAIVTKATEWTPTDSQPRLALLNNFGAAGSNGALLLQDHRPSPPIKPEECEERSTYIWGCSAKSMSALLALNEAIVSHLKNNPHGSLLHDVCYTSTARRQLYNYRISVCAESMDDLIGKLTSATADDVRKISHPEPSAIFLFSGQGSQYKGMGKELFTSSPIFRQTVLDCHHHLIESGFPGCLQVINPESTSSDDLNERDQLQAFQAGIFVLEVALAKMWMSWGIIPEFVTGHSIGMYAALVIAEVVELLDALVIVASRARLMVENCPFGTTGMLAVNAGPAQVEELLHAQDEYSELSIACYNSPSDCVVGGPVTALQALKTQLKNELKCKSTLLNNPLAYHTKAMDPVVESLDKLTRKVVLSPPKIPVVSNVLGRVVAKGEDVFTTEFFARHCRQPVLFKHGMEDLVTNHLKRSPKHTTWIEMGPHPSVLPMVKSMILPNSGDCIPSMRKSVHPWTTLSEALSGLYMSNFKLNWRETFDGFPKPRCAYLPSYQFDYGDFRVTYPHEMEGNRMALKAAAPLPSTGFAFLSRRAQVPSAESQNMAIFDTPISVLAGYIQGHVVCGHALCPASVYHEMALAAAALLRLDDADSEKSKKDPSVDGLAGVSYMQPLLYQEGSQKTMRVTVKSKANRENVKEFSISSYEGSDATRPVIHCQGFIKTKTEHARSKKFLRKHPQIGRMRSLLQNPSKGEFPQTFHTKAIYQKIFTRVVTYSELYQAIQSISINSEGTEALARCRIPEPEETSTEKFAGNPIFMDVLLHVAGFVANLSVKNDDACICKEVEAASVMENDYSLHDPFEVHCSNVYVDQENLVIADAYAVSSYGNIIAVFKGMHFTRVKLAKIEAHFQNAVRAGSRQSAQQKQQSSASKPKSANVTKRATKAPVSKPKKPSADIKAIVAEVCGTDATAIFPSTNFEDLGIDSLMIIELEERINSASPVKFSADELTLCKTVGDIEALVPAGDAEDAEEDSDEKSPMEEVSVEPASTSPSKSPSNLPSIASIIAETCGADPGSLLPNMELEDLGIDSLMMFELEEHLRDALGVEIDSESLTTCRTVRDVETLVGVPDESSISDTAKTIASEPTKGAQASIVKAHTPESSSTEPSTESEDSKDEMPRRNSSIPTSGNATPHTAASSPPSTVPPSDSDSVNVFKDLSRKLKMDRFPAPVQTDKPDSTMFPLFLVHDGSGLCMKYHTIKPLNRALWAIHNPKFFTEEGWESVSSMANAYAARIYATATGPPILGGWSFGGVVAFEAARILLNQGRPLAGVVLIDSPPPLNHVPLSPQVFEAVAGGSSGPRSSSSNSNRSNHIIRERVTKSFGACAGLLAEEFKQDMQGPFPELVLLRSREGFNTEGLNAPRNEWLEERVDVKTSVEGWEKIVNRRVSVRDIPGNHFEPFNEVNVGKVSEALGRACQDLEEDYRRQVKNVQT